MSKLTELEKNMMEAIINEDVAEEISIEENDVESIEEENEEVVADNAIEATEKEENVSEVESKANENEQIENSEEILETQPKVEGTYTPNLSYSVKGNDFEFDDWTKELITSKEKEDKFRDIFTRLKGFDEIKVSRDKLKEEFDNVLKEHTPIKEKVEELSQEQMGWRYFEDVLAKNDNETLLKLLSQAGVDEAKLAYALADRLSMTPQERQAQSVIQQGQIENRQLQGQNQDINKKFEDQSRDIFEMQLGMAVNSHKDVIEKYNNALSDQEAFLKEVQKEGLAYYGVNRKDMPVNQAVENVVRRIQVLMPQNNVEVTNQSQAQVIQQTSAAPIKRRTVIRGQENTIPNVGGSSADSPIGRVAKSIEDLEKIGEDYFKTR